MINCKEASRLSSESHDRSLALGERVSLRLHLIGCKLCSRYARQLELIKAACTHIDEEPAENVQLSNDARDRIRDRLKQR